MNQNVLHPTPSVGELVELARYTVTGGEAHPFFGQRINGVVRVTDRPVDTVRVAHISSSGASSRTATAH